MDTDTHQTPLKELLLENVVRPIYNSVVRPLLPRKVGVYNTVPVRRPKLFDTTDVYPDYEQALIQHIRDAVSDDDHVAIVGGGLGVSSVCTARQGATIEAFEADGHRVAMITETLQLNGVEDSVSISHAIVESEVSINGATEKAEHLPASDLPKCDTLILDCEGAELDILENMTIRPQTVIVEVHPMFGVSMTTAEESLEDLGYNVREATEEATNRGTISILTAVADYDKRE